jgi:hypothetical protein
MNNNIDWPGIRAAAVSVGVREAARQAGKDLPPAELVRFTNRVMQRSKREGWIKQAQALQASVSAPGLPLSANVSTGAQAAAQTLATRKENTRAHLARFAEEAALEAATAPEKLKVARQTKDVAAVMSSVWPEKEQAVALNLWGDTQMIVNVGEAG